MARKMIPREFYKAIAQRVDCNEDRAQYIWQEIVDLIVNELLMYNSISLPNIGELKSVTYGGKKIHMPIDNSPENRGKVKEVYVAPYQVGKLLPSQYFKDAINDKRVTRSAIMLYRENYRKLKEKEALEKQQAIYMEKYQNAVEMMKERHMANAKRQREVNKLSPKRQKQIKQQQPSYWEDFEEEEE